MKINIKALSVNDAWQGKRFKTKAYKAYEKAILLMLRPMEIPEGNLRIDIAFGFSNKASDIDNPCKQFIDCLSKKYGFNDNRIYSLNLLKTIVPKGDEFIEFEISALEKYD